MEHFLTIREIRRRSTRRGIAPVYADKMFRNGIKDIDLLEPEIFKEKLEKGYRFSKNILTKVLNSSFNMSFNQIYDQYIEYGDSLSPYIKDTSVELYNAYKDNKTLLLKELRVSLDVDHGIYPTQHLQTQPLDIYRQGQA